GSGASVPELLTAGLRRRLEQIEVRYDEIGTSLASPEVTSDPKRIRALGQELASLTPIVVTVRDLRASEARAKEAQELIESDDGDLRDLAREELATASNQIDANVGKLRSLLVPRDPNDEKNVIVEIRGGEGGAEGALFAHALYRRSRQLAARNRLKVAH